MSQRKRELEDRFQVERDRRYAEVAEERAKALKIKETADLAALELAREIQTYKDEQANDLRSQIERERGSYATQIDLRAAVERMEALLKPVGDYVATQQGRAEAMERTQERMQPWMLWMAAVDLDAISYVRAHRQVRHGVRGPGHAIH